MMNTTTNGISGVLELAGKRPDIAFVDKSFAKLHEFYISGSINEAEEYAHIFNVLRNCNEVDTVKLYINSGGGSLWTALQFVVAIKECPAQVIAQADGACLSAATMIFLAADTQVISPFSLFMIHTYSGVVGGKGGEIQAQVKMERQWCETILSGNYTDFLTSDEIVAIINGQDLWLTPNDVIKRLNVRTKARDKSSKH